MSSGKVAKSTADTCNKMEVILEFTYPTGSAQKYLYTFIFSAQIKQIAFQLFRVFNDIYCYFKSTNYRGSHKGCENETQERHSDRQAHH